MLYLNPLKEELISLEPRVVFFHDVLTEMEMEKLEELAVPKVLLNCKQSIIDDCISSSLSTIVFTLSKLHEQS
jgi:hypothetical protein